MTALRRELSALGWRAAGFAAAVSLFVLAAGLWGWHIEGRIDKVVIDRDRDHRIIERLVERERLGGGDALQPAPKAGQQPEPGGMPGGGDTGGDTERDVRKHPIGATPPAEPDSVPPSTDTGPDSGRDTGRPTSPPSASPPADPPPSEGPVGSVVDQVGGAVGDVGDRVDDTSCSLAPALCP